MKKNKHRKRLKKKIVMQEYECSASRRPRYNVKFGFIEGDLVAPSRNVHARYVNDGCLEQTQVIPRNAVCMVTEQAGLAHVRQAWRNRPLRLPERRLCVMYEGRLLMVPAKVLRFVEED